MSESEKKSEYQVALCRKMYKYTVLNERTKDLTAIEIRHGLNVFFDDIIIDKAIQQLQGVYE